ncbi:hypothetical protein L3i20_v233870 [Paenibacillus sp. L3-i20]|nr:hypothetical protein L3i20_v233870 [Paenibacillus sp. L3-i20]
MAVLYLTNGQASSKTWYYSSTEMVLITYIISLQFDGALILVVVNVKKNDLNESWRKYEETRLV